MCETSSVDQDVILSDEQIKRWCTDMERLKFLDDSVLHAYEKRHGDLTLQQSEILITLCNMVYGCINKDLP